MPHRRLIALAVAALIFVGTPALAASDPSTPKGALKAFHKAITGGAKDAKKLQSKAESALDKAGKKGVMHKNKVARKKSQVAKAAKSAAGVTTKKAAPKKAAAKKPAAKKAPAKKTTTKKK